MLPSSNERAVTGIVGGNDGERLEPRSCTAFPLTTMVTGIEAAGLALAVFPLIVQGLGIYLKGVRKIKDLRDSTDILNRLIRHLKVECLCFEEVCAQLLEGMVSARDMTQLMSGNAWMDPKLQVLFQQRMGDEASELFTELVEELHESLKNLRDDLGIQSEVC